MSGGWMCTCGFTEHGCSIEPALVALGRYRCVVLRNSHTKQIPLRRVPHVRGMCSLIAGSRPHYKEWPTEMRVRLTGSRDLACKTACCGGGLPGTRVPPARSTWDRWTGWWLRAWRACSLGCERGFSSDAVHVRPGE